MASSAASLKLSSKMRSTFKSRSRYRFCVSIVLFVTPISILIVYITLNYVQISRLCESAPAAEVRIFRLEILKHLFTSFLTWFGYKHKQDVHPGLSEEICSHNAFNILTFLLRQQLPSDIKASLQALVEYLVTSVSVCSEWAATMKVQLAASPSLIFYISVILSLTVLVLAIRTLFVFFIRRKKNMYQYCLDVSLNSSFLQNDDSVEEEESEYTISNMYRLRDGPRPRHEPLSVMSRLAHWLFLLLVAAASFSFPWEFMRLYQKEVAIRASRVTLGMPAECQETSFGLWDSLRLMLRNQFSWSSSDGPCSDYYYAILVNPFWEVSPLMVLSSVFTRCLVHPVQVTSAALGRSLREFFSEIPAQWQPFLMLVAAAMALVLLLMTCSYRLSIPLLLRIEPRTPVQGHAHVSCGRKDRRLEMDDADMANNCASALRRRKGDVVYSPHLQKSTDCVCSFSADGEKEMGSPDWHTSFVMRRNNILNSKTDKNGDISSNKGIVKDLMSCFCRGDAGTRGIDNTLSTDSEDVRGSKKGPRQTKVNSPNIKTLKRTTRTCRGSNNKGKGQAFLEDLQK